MDNVKRWCGRAAAGTETAAMNPMVEWHGDPDEDTPYVLASDYDALLNRFSEETRRAKANEDRANHISVLHGEKFTMLSELFARVRGALSPEEVKAWDLRIYGPGRPVRPHATGPTINTLEKP